MTSILLSATALFAAGALALTPQAAVAFVCDSAAAGESGEGATDGGVANNFACGVSANASGGFARP